MVLAFQMFFKTNVKATIFVSQPAFSEKSRWINEFWQGESAYKNTAGSEAAAGPPVRASEALSESLHSQPAPYGIVLL